MKWWEFFKEKIPFAITGGIATGVNYGLFMLLADRYLERVPATMIAYSSSVVLNFFMQRYFVFELKRSARSAFGLSMLVSGGGLVLDAVLVGGLNLIPFFHARKWLTKLLATGIVFFYNYYGKRRVFEGR